MHPASVREWIDAEDENGARGVEAYGNAGRASGLALMPVRSAIWLHTDVSPIGHFKVLHRQGVVARASLEWEPWVGEAYTGIFRSGAAEALLRLSWADAPARPGRYLPGIAVKCLRSGVPSANLVALDSVMMSQPTPNMLARPLCTNVPLPATAQNRGRRGARTWREMLRAPIENLSALLTGARFDWAQRIDMEDFDQPSGAAARLTGLSGVSDMALFDANGAQAHEPRWPFALVLQPNPRAALAVERALAAGLDPLDALAAALGGNEELYRIYLVDALDPSEVRLGGTLTLASKPVRSTLGDSRLMFRHSMLAEGARLRGPGGDRAKEWLAEATAGVQRRWEYEGVEQYKPFLEPYPNPPPRPPPHCPLETAWRAADAERWGCGRALNDLALVALLTLAAPLALALSLAVLPLAFLLAPARTYRFSGALPTLLRVALWLTPPLPHARRLALRLRDSSALQLLASRAAPSARHLCLLPGVHGVWGSEGLRAFYSDANVARDPTTWPLPPVGLVSTVWGTPHGKPASPPKTLSALTYGCPVLDGAAHRQRKARFVAAAQVGSLLSSARQLLRREFEALGRRVQQAGAAGGGTRGGGAAMSVYLAEEGFTIAASVACDLLFGLPVSSDEAAALGRALKANFSTFDAIAYRLHFGRASASASQGHEAIFAYMRRAIDAQRKAPSAGCPLATYLAAAPPSGETLNEESLLSDVYHFWNGCYAIALHIPHMAFALQHMPEERAALRAEATALAEAAPRAMAELRAAAPRSFAFASEVVRYFNGVQIVLGTALRDIPAAELAPSGSGGAPASGVAIQRGDFVAAFLYATNRMAAHHDAPDTFWPQRWAAEPAVTGILRKASGEMGGLGGPADQPGFAPFGAGDNLETHRCGGEALASALLPLLAAEMGAAWSWELELPGERPLTVPLFALFQSGMPLRPTAAAPAAAPATCARGARSARSPKAPFASPGPARATVHKAVRCLPSAFPYGSVVAVLAAACVPAVALSVWDQPNWTFFLLLPLCVGPIAALQATLPHSDLYLRLLLVSWRVLRRLRTQPRGMDIGRQRRLPRAPLALRAPYAWIGAPRVALPPFYEEEHPESLYMLAPWLTTCWNAALRQLPLSDDFTPFDPGEEPKAFVRSWMGSLLPSPVNGVWADVHSDATLTRLCFLGIGAHRLERLSGDAVADEAAAAFVVRTNMLSELSVREGYASYGGDAYFDAGWRVLRIVRRELAPGGARERSYAPGDSRWEYAKFAFRGSLVTLVTLVDHLHELHLQWTAALVKAKREALEPDHPVRRLLTPFTFGTIGVNDRAHDHLISPHGMAERCFALDAAGLQAAWRAAPRLVRGVVCAKGSSESERALFALDRERILGAMIAEGVETPYTTQCRSLVAILGRFVRGYLRACYADDEAIAADVDLRRFMLVALAGLDGVLPPVEDAASLAEASAHPHGSPPPHPHGSSLAEALLGGGAAGGGAHFFEVVSCLLTSFLERVTAGHEQAGFLAPYTTDPAFCAWRWSPGELCPSRCSALAQGMLTAMTDMRMPPLMGAPGSLDDWSHALAPKGAAGNDPAIATLYAELQEGLADLARQCDEHNAAAAARPFPHCWPTYTCHPRVLEVSVSI